MQKNNVVYPHHIPFIGNLVCDICNSPGNKKYTIPYSKFRGLVACDKISCKNKVKKSLLKTSIPLKVLIKKFGEKININRSNGKIDSGWKISSYGVSRYKRWSILGFCNKR